MSSPGDIPLSGGAKNEGHHEEVHESIPLTTTPTGAEKPVEGEIISQSKKRKRALEDAGNAAEKQDKVLEEECKSEGEAEDGHLGGHGSGKRVKVIIVSSKIFTSSTLIFSNLSSRVNKIKKKGLRLM